MSLKNLLALMRLLGPKFKEAWPLIMQLIEIWVPAGSREAGRIMGASSAGPTTPEMQEVLTEAESLGVDPVEVQRFGMMLQERESMTI